MPKDFPKSPQIHIMRVESKKESHSIQHVSLQDPILVTEPPFHAIREKHKSAYMSWTKELDDELAVMYCGGHNVRDLSEYFGRTKGAIRSRIKKLKL